MKIKIRIAILNARQEILGNVREALNIFTVASLSVSRIAWFVELKMSFAFLVRSKQSLLDYRIVENYCNLYENGKF